MNKIADGLKDALEMYEPRDSRGNLIDPNNTWSVYSPWWFETNAVYTKWRAGHDRQVQRAKLH